MTLTLSWDFEGRTTQVSVLGGLYRSVFSFWSRALSGLHAPLCLDFVGSSYLCLLGGAGGYWRDWLLSVDHPEGLAGPIKGLGTESTGGRWGPGSTHLGDSTSLLAS